MPTGTITIGATIGGLSHLKQIIKTGDHPNVYQIPLPVASVVESWDFVTTTTGNATMTAGHGLTDGTYDAYWSGGYRYGCTGVFTSDVLALSAGAGDDFPIDSTAMNVCKQVEINASIDGDAVQAISVLAEYTNTAETAHGSADMQDSGAASIEAIDLVANEPWVWWESSGITNPLTGNVVVDCFASNGSADNAATLFILSLEDSTP